MSRSRSASLSAASPFVAAFGTNRPATAPDDILSALSLAGRENKGFSRSGTPIVLKGLTSPATLLSQQFQEELEKEIIALSLRERAEPLALVGRTPVVVRRRGALPFRATLSPSTVVGGSSRSASKVQPGGSSSHPFEEPGFELGLKAAGYCEMLDTSRKRIKSRFSHGLGKEKFKVHLESFLREKGLKKRGEYMIRFVGEQDVHSPFVHLYTTSLPSNHLTVKVYPSDSDPSHSESFTLWTHLRTINGTSHWSCRAPKFWPLRVVLAGPNEDDIIPPAPRKPLKKKGGDDHDDGDDRGDPEVKANTKENSKIVVADPTNEVIADPVPALQIPTILASVKQLGVAVAKSIPPGVQTSIQTQFVALKSSWTAAWAPKPAPEEEYESEDSEERRARRRERRRARREKEEYEAREAKEDRRRERRRLRSQTMG